MGHDDKTRNGSAAFIEMIVPTPESFAKRVKASTAKRRRVMQRKRVPKTLKDFRYAPDSGGKADVAEGPSWANSGLMQRSSASLFDHPIGRGRAVPGIFLARRSILTRSGPARAQPATKNDNYQCDAARRAAAARKRSIARPSSRKTASTILNEIQQFSALQ
jgi:hypothetical protein